MKIWILLLMLAFAENSSLDNSLSRRVVKREFNVQNAEKTTFVQTIFFNTVGKVMPQGWLLNAVINLFKSAQSKPSIIDQIREEVQKGVMKGITNFYNDFLYTEVTSCQVFEPPCYLFIHFIGATTTTTTTSPRPTGYS